MEDTLLQSHKMIAELGIFVTISAAFIGLTIWLIINYTRMVTSTMPKVAAAIENNTALMLRIDNTISAVANRDEIVTAALKIITDEIGKHDKRTEFMNKDIRKIVAWVDQRILIAGSKGNVLENPRIKTYKRR